MVQPGDEGGAAFERRVRALFEQAASLPATEREGFIARAAGDDGALAERVRELLRHADAPTPQVEVPREAARQSPAGDKVQSTQTSEMLKRLESSPRLDTERYELQGEVDRGGIGAILRIHDRQLNRRLAMKVLLEREAPQDDYEQQLAHQILGRFLEEAQVTSQLDHPGVVPVHELGLDEHGKVFFTMRLVRGRHAGEVFQDAFHRRDGWTTTRGLEVILKVCDTMGFAHDKGVLHRDLKPANVMVGRFGEVYVMDWGLAKVTGQEDRRDVRIRPMTASSVSQVDSARKQDADSDDGASVVSMDGQKLGTPSYMPPEQARSEALDVRADVYAIGAMVYELVTGTAPYTVPGVRKHAYRILEDVALGPPRRVEELQKGVPAELVAIIDKAMARDREDRYADTLALAADLRAFLDDRAVQAYRTGPLVELKLWVKRNKPLASSLVAAVLILVAGVVVSTVLANQNAALAQEKTELAASETKAKEEAAQRAEENARLAQEKTDLAAAETEARKQATALAMQVQEQAAVLDARVRDFDQLSGVVQYEEAVAAEASLYPGWPDKLVAMDAWLSDVDALLAKEDSIRATMRSLREKALPMAGAELDAALRAHERWPEYEALQKRAAAERAAQDVRSGRVTWVEPELPAELQGKTASEYNSLAWPVVDWEKPERPRGAERVALACARAAFAAATTDGDRATFGDTLAWALFFCGRDAEAVSQAEQNVGFAPAAEKEKFAGYVRELQARVAAAAGDAGERRVAETEAALAVLGDELRPWRFGDGEDERAAGFLHGALAGLVRDLAALEVLRAGVVQRRGWAQRIEQLTLDLATRHPWPSVRAAIEANDKYAGCEIALTDEDVVTRWLGLVPIGENPVTGLWEFYDLRSAWDGASDPVSIAIPQHEADGSIKVTGATGIVFVLLPGGTVTLGSQKDDEKAPFYDPQHRNDEKLHPVTLSSFLLARHELTQGQWSRLWTWDEALRDPSQYKSGANVGGAKITLANPVEQVDWSMCDTLLTRHGMVLPTEAQWEYGCRGGTTSPWNVEKAELQTVANLASQDAKPYGVSWTLESWRDGHVVHAPVGSYRANDFGLHDVHGNVWEWCQEWLDDYGSERPGDGQRSVRSSAYRVNRGGSFADPATAARSADRIRLAPSVRLSNLGLRPARIITF